VHYYYASIDDLLVEAYRRSTKDNFEILTRALESDDPVRELWRLQTEAHRMTLAIEFLALSNHHKVIKAEIARYADYARDLQAAAISKALEKFVDPEICPPVCFTVLMAGVARALIIEESTGITRGHSETRAFAQWMLERISGQGAPTKTASPAAYVEKCAVEKCAAGAGAADHDTKPTRRAGLLRGSKAR
jgi:AcrR family transcriptional regulator